MFASQNAEGSGSVPRTVEDDLPVRVFGGRRITVLGDEASLERSVDVGGDRLVDPRIAGVEMGNPGPRSGEGDRRPGRVELRVLLIEMPAERAPGGFAVRRVLRKAVARLGDRQWLPVEPLVVVSVDVVNQIRL